MATVTDTVHVRGIRCERCMARLGHVLKGHEGLESANATLTGAVTLVYDDALTTREALLKDMTRGGFREQDPLV
ncbi:MAG TPA: cation transporter [Gaiellaceae bacterium]|jgi:copper chaperone CopZ